MVQSERGQKEISAAKVREVESELSKAQNSLKAERLLLQQASTPACFHVGMLITYVVQWQCS